MHRLLQLDLHVLPIYLSFLQDNLDILKTKKYKKYLIKF